VSIGCETLLVSTAAAFTVSLGVATLAVSLGVVTATVSAGVTTGFCGATGVGGVAG
jgi:hypothetical protein